MRWLVSGFLYIIVWTSTLIGFVALFVVSGYLIYYGQRYFDILSFLFLVIPGSIFGGMVVAHIFINSIPSYIFENLDGEDNQ
ncbi:hypothetical protein [Candidatus Uabimicrobium sp. HlEnr_7]|uniref:hypothetical protein n=1 Tax=Candidatus Uabimicrobium helgolandensis TaxID=3095367 RepID=UPI003556D32B